MTKTAVDKIWDVRAKAIEEGRKADLSTTVRLVRAIAILHNSFPMEDISVWAEAMRINLSVNTVELTSKVVQERDILAILSLGWESDDNRDEDLNSEIVPDTEFTHFSIFS